MICRLGRVETEMSREVVFDPSEWKATLRVMHPEKRLPKKPPNLNSNSAVGLRHRTARTCLTCLHRQAAVRPRVPKRIDELIGYLLRKKRWIILPAGRHGNYADRKAMGSWIAECTWVEKCNDLAVSDRCEHHGMSWTESGVMAIALYADERKKHPMSMTQLASFDTKITRNCELREMFLRYPSSLPLKN
jgi:hypothetical protein